MTKLPALLIVDSRDNLAEICKLLQVSHPGTVIKCTADTSGEELRNIPMKSATIVVGLAIQLIDRLSKKQHLKRSWFKTMLLVDLNETLARGCRDQVQEILRDVHEDIRIIITCCSTITNEVLAFKKYLKNTLQIKQWPAEELSLARVHSFFINYKHSGWKLKKLLELIKTNGEHTVIICNSRRTVEALAEELQQVGGVQANTLHADLDQRDRNDVVTMFLSGITQYLIATELAYNSVSRDIENSLIVNYDLPLTKEKYLKRCGNVLQG